MSKCVRCFFLGLVLAAATSPVVRAGGFAIPEQGAKAMALGGAFVAQADDPTALFYNVGGLAFFEERQVAAGLTLVTSADESFVGSEPGAAAGTTGTLESLAEPVPHFYWVQPVNENWNFGLAINSPFGLKTEWMNPDEFSGRFINTEASMLAMDVNPNVGIQLTERLGVGFGAIVRFTEVEFNRRLPTLDPLTGSVIDAAATRLASDLEHGIGWQLGMLYRHSESLSWGLSYRSGFTVDYRGTARLTAVPTGNPQLDALLAATLPFGQDLAVATEVEFPDKLSVGVAFALGERSLLEVDVERTGWSSFDELPIRFPQQPFFDETRPERWDDSNTYRFGLRVGRGSGSEWRFGLLWDESPQPPFSVSPLLPDTDRAGYSVGWGGGCANTRVDLALSYLDFEPRTTIASVDNFNGTYSQTGWLLAATFGF